VVGEGIEKGEEDARVLCRVISHVFSLRVFPRVFFTCVSGRGQVNHCHLHCRLAKFRGLMRRVKYGAVIGHEMRFFVCAQYELPGYGFLFSQSRRRLVYPPSHQTTEFRQTTV